MKRFTRRAFVFFGIFFALGMILCTAGWIMGYEPGQYLKEYRLSGIGESSGGQELEQTEFDGVSSISLSAGASVCNISAYSGDNVRVEISDSTLLTCEQNGEELEISFGAGEHSIWQWMKRKSAAASEIRIYVPETLLLKRLYVEVGASDFQAEGIRCRDLEMICGAGKLSFSGEVKRNCSVECGMGAVEMLLKGMEKDFDYSLECGLGNIRIQDGPELAGAGEYTKDNRSGREMELECGLGSISVTFQAF